MLAPEGRVWLYSLTINASILLLGIFTGVVVARLLLPEGRGALSAVLFWPQFVASIALLSLPQAITYITGQQRDRVHKGTLLATGAALALGLSLLVGLVSYPLLPYIFTGARANLLSITQCYLLLFLPFNFLSLALLSIDQGLMNLSRFNLLRLIGPVTYFIGLMVLWLLDEINVTNFVWANLAGTIAMVFFSLVGFWKVSHASISLHLAKEILVNGWRFHMATLLFTLGSQVDRVVVLALLDNISVGYYAVASTVATSGTAVVVSTFYTVLFPKIANQRDRLKQVSIFTEGLRYASLLVVLITILVMALTPWLLPLIFGHAYADAVIPSLLLLLANVPFAMRQITIHCLRGFGSGRAAAISEAISLIVFLLLTFPMIHIFGLSGVGITLIVSNVVSMGYLASHLNKDFGIGIASWWGGNISTLLEVFEKAVNLLKQRGQNG